jgi:hypothetical protein
MRGVLHARLYEPDEVARAAAAYCPPPSAAPPPLLLPAYHASPVPVAISTIGTTATTAATPPARRQSHYCICQSLVKDIV